MGSPRLCIASVVAVIAWSGIGCGGNEKSSDAPAGDGAVVETGDRGRATPDKASVEDAGAPDFEEGKSVLGSWSGEVIQIASDGRRHRIAQSVRVEWKRGALTGASQGNVLTSPTRCGGRLAYSSTQVGAYVFRYTEKRDPDGCIDRSTVILRPRRRGLEYREIYETRSRSGTISGTLTREG